MLLGEVEQLPVLQPCRDGQRAYPSSGPKMQGLGCHTGGGDPMSCLDGRPPRQDYQDKVRKRTLHRLTPSSACGGAGPLGPSSSHHLGHKGSRTRRAEGSGPSCDARYHTKTGAPWAMPPILPALSPSSSRFFRAGVRRSTKNAMQGCDQLWSLCQGHGAAMSQTHVSCPAQDPLPSTRGFRCPSPPTSRRAVVGSSGPSYRPPGAQHCLLFLPSLSSDPAGVMCQELKLLS